MNSLQWVKQRTMTVFDRDVHSWGLTPRAMLFIAAIPLIIVLVMIAMIKIPDVFVWLTAEDSVIEWLQFLLIFTASMIFARLGFLLLKGREVKLGIFCLLVAFGTFFVAGEEIAWGQRIFGWGTPEALEAVNPQHETTLHNISSAHSLFVYGMMFVGFYGALMPVLGSVWWSQRRETFLIHLLIPPLCLVPAFFMAFGYRFSRLFLGLDDLGPRYIFAITKFSEVTEVCLYFGIMVFAWLNLRYIQRINNSSRAN